MSAEPVTVIAVVESRVVAAGSKSEREATVAEVDGRPLVLRRRGAMAYDDDASDDYWFFESGFTTPTTLSLGNVGKKTRIRLKQNPAFFDAAGRNVTPDKLKAAERGALEAVCDAALRRTIEHLSPRFVVGVGAYAESRARSALEGMDVTIGRILHPSPASPAANRGWSAQVTKQLRAMGIALPRARAERS